MITIKLLRYLFSQIVTFPPYYSYFLRMTFRKSKLRIILIFD